MSPDTLAPCATNASFAEQAQTALSILAGCPDGATAFNLSTRFGIHPDTIDVLMNSRLVKPEPRYVVKLKDHVLWLRITELGREALKKAQH